MGEAFAKVFARLGEAGVAAAGPPMCKYTAYAEDSITYEAGLPVAEPFGGEGDVVAGEIGGGKAAVGMHIGPYGKLGETYGQMQAWLEAQGLKPSTVMWESYLNDPDTTEPEQLRTEVYWPVEEE